MFVREKTETQNKTKNNNKTPQRTAPKPNEQSFPLYSETGET